MLAPPRMRFPYYRAWSLWRDEELVAFLFAIWLTTRSIYFFWKISGAANNWNPNMKSLSIWTRRTFFTSQELLLAATFLVIFIGCVLKITLVSFGSCTHFPWQYTVSLHVLVIKTKRNIAPKYFNASYKLCHGNPFFKHLCLPSMTTLKPQAPILTAFSPERRLDLALWSCGTFAYPSRGQSQTHIKPSCHQLQARRVFKQIKGHDSIRQSFYKTLHIRHNSKRSLSQ